MCSGGGLRTPPSEIAGLLVTEEYFSRLRFRLLILPDRYGEDFKLPNDQFQAVFEVFRYFLLELPDIAPNRIRYSRTHGRTRIVLLDVKDNFLPIAFLLLGTQ